MWLDDAFQYGELVAPAKDVEKPREWTLWGGSITRNPVNLVEKGIAREWESTPVPKNLGMGKHPKWKNVKWSVPLGSKA